MNRTWIFAALLLPMGSGCSEHLPSTEECRAISASKAVIARCYGGDIRDGRKYVGDTNCFPFGNAVPVTGILVTQTETSDFFPGADRFAPAMLKGSDTWLESEGPARRALDRERHLGPGIFRIDAMGRHSLCPTGYGAYGVSRNAVSLTRIFSMTRLADPRSSGPR